MAEKTVKERLATLETKFNFIIVLLASNIGLTSLPQLFQLCASVLA